MPPSILSLGAVQQGLSAKRQSWPFQLTLPGQNQIKHFDPVRPSPTIAESTTCVTFVVAPTSSVDLCQLRLPSLVLRVQTQGEKYLCQGK